MDSAGEREGASRGRGGRVEIESGTGQSHQKRGGDREDSEREPGRKVGRERGLSFTLTTLASASLLLLPSKGWGGGQTPPHGDGG